MFLRYILLGTQTYNSHSHSTLCVSKLSHTTILRCFLRFPSLLFNNNKDLKCRNMLLTEHGFYLSGQVSVACVLSPLLQRMRRLQIKCSLEMEALCSHGALKLSFSPLFLVHFSLCPHHFWSQKLWLKLHIRAISRLFSASSAAF